MAGVQAGMEPLALLGTWRQKFREPALAALGPPSLRQEHRALHTDSAHYVT